MSMGRPKYSFLSWALRPAGISFFLVGLTLPCLKAAEFEAVDKLRVGTYAVIQGSADVQGAAFSVGGSSFAVSYGKIGIGTSTPAALLHISSAAGVAGNLVLISTGASNIIRMTGAGEIYANKYYAGALQGLSTPSSADAAANKAYVDGRFGSCAPGTATAADIATGKTADFDCDNTAEIGTGGTGMALPDTGQTGDYTATFGEDSDYQPAASQPSYTDNADGTITDNRTGLMWAKDGNGPGCNNGVTINYENALTFCEGLSFASYTDWRVPNGRELLSIVNSQNFAPAVNTTYFTNTAGYYWSSTVQLAGDWDPWALWSDDGVINPTPAGTLINIRCVR